MANSLLFLAPDTGARLRICGVGTTDVAAPRLVRDTLGLIFADNFNRANGALGANWTGLVNGGDQTIVSNQVKSDPAQTARESRNRVADAAAAPSVEIVAEATVTFTEKNIFAEVCLFDPTTGVANSWRWYVSRTPTDLAHGQQLIQRVANVDTQIFAADATALAFNTPYRLKLWVKNGQQKAYRDTALIGSGASAALNDRAMAGAIGKGTPGHDAGTFVTHDTFVSYRGNSIIVNGLPAGWKAKADAMASVVAVAGTATIDLAGATCPLTTIRVLDATDNEIAASVPTDGLWGGDVWHYAAEDLPYTFLAKPVPKWLAPGMFATFELLGLDVMHNNGVDLIAVPILDGVRLDSQAFALQAAAPTDWTREILEGRFFAVGQKCTFEIRSNSLPGLFHLMDAYLDGVPEPAFRRT